MKSVAPTLAKKVSRSENILALAIEITTIEAMNQEVIQGFKSGESWAFTEIYKKFLKPIQSYVGSKVGNESIAQEITQEVFLKAFRFSSSYQMSFAFTTWLWTIARNTVLDFRRRSGNEPSASAGPEVRAEDVAETGADAESLLKRKELRRQIYRMTRILSPTQRKTLWLRVVAQQSYQEVAGRLGLSVSAARSIVHRTRQELQIAGFSDPFAELVR